MNALHAHVAIAAAPWQQARNRRSHFAWGVLLALCVAPVVASAGFISWLRALHGSGAVLAITVAVAWLGVFVNLRQQNHPTLARLLPGQPARLREVALALFWAAAVSMGLLLSAVFSGPWLPWVLLTAVTLAVATASMRWPLLWVVNWVPLQLGVSAWYRWPASHDAAAWALQAWTGNRLSLSLAFGLALSLGLSRLLQAGGATHRSAYAREESRRRQMQRSMAGQTSVRDSGPLMLGAGKLFQVLYRRWLAHLCAHPQATPRHTLARVEMVYTIGNHWTVMLVVGGVILAVGGVTALLAQLVFNVDLGPALQQGAGTGLLFGLMSSSMSMLLSFRQSMYRGRREQALLRLLPGVPQGLALNRWVGGRLLGQLVLAWAVTAGGVALFTWWVDGPRWILGCAVLALPFGLGLLRDWSTLAAPTGMGTTALVGAMILVCTAGGMAVAWTDTSPGLLLAAELPLVAAAAAWRWHRLARFAPALPVGRAA
jgi:hypothetical protein